MRTLVIGAGQIGGAIAGALNQTPTIANVPWADQPAAEQAIRAQVAAFLSSQPAEPWAICWAAGKGVVGTPESSLREERACLDEALGTVASMPPSVHEKGRVLLVSSAGGIHATEGPDVCTELTQPTPTSAYGRSKLLQEDAVRALATQTGVACLLGRISNVYGPGQDLGKPQGFISHLCNAMLHRTTFVLTVPPDTIRDFIFSRDVGRRMAGWIASESTPEPGTAATKLFASGRSTSLQQVVRTVRAVAGVPSRITESPQRQGDQPARTRFRSVVLPDLDAKVPLTSLEEGVNATWQWTLKQAMRPVLTPPQPRQDLLSSPG